MTSNLLQPENYQWEFPAQRASNAENISIWWRHHLAHCWQEVQAKDEHTELTHWGRATHVCVVKLTIIGSDNGLSPDRRQAIIWTNAGVLLIRTLGTNFSDFLSKIRAFSFKKMHLKMSSAKCRPFCLGLNVLINNKAMNRTSTVMMNGQTISKCSRLIRFSTFNDIVCKYT